MILQFGVEFKESYELMVSAWAAAFAKQQGVLDISGDWYKWCKAKLSSQGLALLDEIRRMDQAIPVALLLYCPDETALGFINWVKKLSGQEAYEIVYSFDPNAQRKPPQTLHKACQTLAKGLTMWYDSYFSRIGGPIVEELHKRAADDASREKEFENRPQEMIRELSQSLIWDAEAVTEITLIPQAHLSPWPIYQIGGDHGVIFYPVFSRRLAGKDEHPHLERVLKTLGDPSRIQLLKFIGNGVVRFTDLVKDSGLAKSTVHHHIIALRSAGLLWLHVGGDASARFSIRWEAVRSLSSDLERLLQGK